MAKKQYERTILFLLLFNLIARTAGKRHYYSHSLSMAIGYHIFDDDALDNFMDSWILYSFF